MLICMNLWCVNGFWRSWVNCCNRCISWYNTKAKLAMMWCSPHSHLNTLISTIVGQVSVMLLGTSNNTVLPGDCAYRQGEVFFWHFLNAKSSEKCSPSARSEGNWVEFTDQMMILCCGTTRMHEFKKCPILFKCSPKDNVPASWQKSLQEWKWENKGLFDCCIWLNSNSSKHI